MKTILVTGGTGLIGCALKGIEKNYQYNFIFLDSKQCNLTDYRETLHLFEGLKPVYVIHLAAYVGGLYKQESSKVKMYEDNILINTNVIKAARETGVQRLIACLSTCIFPDKTEYPILSEYIHNGPPHPSNEGYAYAKRMLEVHCRLCNEQFGTDYICITPTNVYGPNDNYNLMDSHVIPGLIHRCYLSKRDAVPFVIKGSGNALRQFVFNTDLAKIIMGIFENEGTKQCSFIISPHEEYSIKEIVEMIAKLFENTQPIIFDTTFSDGQYSKTVKGDPIFVRDPVALEKQLMDPTFVRDRELFNFTPIKQGLLETIDWFNNEYPNLRK